MENAPYYKVYLYVQEYPTSPIGDELYSRGGFRLIKNHHFKFKGFF